MAISEINSRTAPLYCSAGCHGTGDRPSQLENLLSVGFVVSG